MTDKPNGDETMPNPEEHVVAIFKRIQTERILDNQTAATLTLATVVAELAHQRFNVKIDNPSGGLGVKIENPAAIRSR